MCHSKKGNIALRWNEDMTYSKDVTKLRPSAAKPKICFISFAAYPTLSRADMSVAGGAERQQVLLAQELQKSGLDVSFIVLDHGQEAVETWDGIRAIKSLKAEFLPQKRKSPIAPFYWYIIGPFLLWKSLARANADIYFQKMVGPSSALAVLFPRLKKRKFIYTISSDRELQREETNAMAFPLGFFCRFTIKNAHSIIAQSKYQQELLKNNFGKESVLIKSIYPLPKERRSKIKPPLVLWAATIRRSKQPEIFLELARQIPEAKFQMVGGGAVEEEAQYFEEIRRQAEQLPNLKFVGFVPPHQISRYFAQAAIFVNTSTIEGFPNTFLQAWGNYTPVVSLNCDPDEIICRYKLGFHSKSFKQLVEDVKLLLSDAKLREKMGLSGKKYLEREHNPKDIVDQYMAVFKQLMSGGIAKSKNE